MKLQPAGLQRAHRIAARYKADVGARPLFTAATDNSAAELFIYDDIGGMDLWTGEEGVTAKKVADAISAIGGAKRLDIFINSGGGDIFEAKAILAQLSRFKGQKVVHIDGIAASAATLIAMGGDRIITAPAATWMIHEVSAVAYGRAVDLRSLADLLDIENKTFAETYASRTGSKLEDVLAWMSAETWMNAEEAKARGFTDEISELKKTDGGFEQLAASLKNATSTLRGLAG